MKFNKLVKCVGAALVLVVASDGVAGVAATAAQAAAANHAASKAQQQAPYFKPGAPVQLVGPSEYLLQVNDELEAQLGFSVAAGGTLELSLRADEGLVLLSQSQWQASNLRQLIVPIKVRAERASMAYIHVFARFTSDDGQVSTRSLAVAFDSRSKAEVARQKAQIPLEVISMQAKETIY